MMGSRLKQVLIISIIGLIISSSFCFWPIHKTSAWSTVPILPSTIYGRVEDSRTWKSLAGANIELKWADNILPTQTTSTDSLGNYSFSADYLCFAPFSLTVNLDGYESYSIDNVKVKCNSSKRINIKLKPIANYWRKNIQPGDILYDKDAIYSDLLGTFTIGHTAMYVGDLNNDGHTYHNQEIEAESGGVTNNDISSWDYPKRDNVYLLRVNTTDQIKANAVNFVETQLQAKKPYDWRWWQKDWHATSTSWYCSELDWAAYYNASNKSINLDSSPRTHWVSPEEIFKSPYTYIVSSHSTGFWDKFKGLVLIAASPVNMQITTPSGKIVSKTKNQIPGAYYIEDYKSKNGHTGDLVILPPGSPSGQYSVKVVREPDAPMGSTYSLEIYKGQSGDHRVIVHNHSVPLPGQSDLYNFNVNKSSNSTSSTTSVSYDIHLHSGWNLISIPTVPDDTNIDDVLGDAASSVNSIWTYDPTNPKAVNGWLVYNPNNPAGANSLNKMTAGYGYWINIKNNSKDVDIVSSGNLIKPGPHTPPSRKLVPGWNLVGYYELSGQNPSSTIKEIFDYLSPGEILKYDNETGYSRESSTTEVQPGDAFWILVKKKGIY